jgi:2-dehydropantoate 2-reductase
MDSIYVVGAGGVGCAVGYALRGAGVRVVFVDADEEKVAWGRCHGVRIDRRRALPAEFVIFREWHPPSGAVVLLCTKCFDNAAVLERLPPAVTLIPIQNGFDPALAAYDDSPEGIASFVSECTPHLSHTRITRRGQLHFGYRQHSSPCPPADAVIKLLKPAAFFGVKVVADILPYKYSKLMYNAAISPLAAVAGLDNGELLLVPKARRLFFALLRENYAILEAAGVRLATIGPFHPATVSRILDRPAVAHALALVFYPTLRGSYCSMAGDLPRGRTEIDYYNRHLIGVAGDRPCPLNRAVYALVKRMEQESIAPHLDALDSLVTSSSPELSTSCGASASWPGIH